MGNNPAFAFAAESLGRALAARQIGLVHGGGKAGLTGAIADAVVESGGQAVGVMPQGLVEESKHGRKKHMIRVSVLYAQGGKFDFDYYANNHMKLVHRLLDPFGLVKTEVDKGMESAPYAAIGHLVFKSKEDMQRGLHAHDPELAADLVHFSDIKPQFQISEIIA